MIFHFHYSHFLYYHFYLLYEQKHYHYKHNRNQSFNTVHRYFLQPTLYPFFSLFCLCITEGSYNYGFYAGQTTLFFMHSNAFQSDVLPHRNIAGCLRNKHRKLLQCLNA